MGTKCPEDSRKESAQSRVQAGELSKERVLHSTTPGTLMLQGNQTAQNTVTGSLRGEGKAGERVKRSEISVSCVPRLGTAQKLA
jgi:hypothetical protein